MSLVRVTEMMGGIYEGLEMYSRVRASGVTKERQLGVRIPAREVGLDEDSMWAALRRRMGARRSVVVVSPVDGCQPGGAGGGGDRGATGEERPENASGDRARGGRGRPDALDEDVSVRGLPAGRSDRTARGERRRRVGESPPNTTVANDNGGLSPTLLPRRTR